MISFIAAVLCRLHVVRILGKNGIIYKKPSEYVYNNDFLQEQFLYKALFTIDHLIAFTNRYLSSTYIHKLSLQIVTYKPLFIKYCLKTKKLHHWWICKAALGHTLGILPSTLSQHGALGVT